jgi:transcriptional regulator with XRE-family HTH domain
VTVLSYQKIQALGSAVARVLREARKAQGLSMYSVAEKSGLSPQMVSYVEREMRAPTLETFFRLCHALSLEPSDVMARAQKAVK